MDEFEMKRLTAEARRKMAQIDRLFEAVESGQEVAPEEFLRSMDELKAIWLQLGAAEKNPKLIEEIDRMRNSIVRPGNENN
jgi:elongation factor P--beta-lysine ligase